MPFVLEYSMLKWYLSMIILRDFPCKSVLFGLVSYNDPFIVQVIQASSRDPTCFRSSLEVTFNTTFNKKSIFYHRFSPERLTISQNCRG